MTSFDDREQAFENKFKHEEELKFRINARAIRLFGSWAAVQLGLTGSEIDLYAEEIVETDFREPGVKDVLRRVQKDLSAKGVDMTEHHLENEFNEHLVAARHAVMH